MKLVMKINLLSVLISISLMAGCVNSLQTRFGLDFREIAKNNVTLDECKVESSIDDFPPDIFTESQRQNGAILLHLLGAIYFFTLLAVVCNDYFLPCVDCICKDLNISKDVAAATFMATATTTPELFTNVISTFVAESDMGIGTIIGSLMFNTLGVAAVAAIATVKPVQLEWWPITRDCALFSINISVLVVFAWDSKITMNESIVLVCLYFLYFVLLFNNDRILRVFRRCRGRQQEVTRQNSYDFTCDTESGRSSIDGYYKHNPDVGVNGTPVFSIFGPPTLIASKTSSIEDDTLKQRKSLWQRPLGNNWRTAWWLYTWPIKCILTVTIPNPKTWRKLYPLTFLMCVIFIGLNSYMIVWMITIMGHTFSVPESVMGLTFLAAGGCMPEAISSVLMVRKGNVDGTPTRGEGGIGVSNSLGANSLAVLLSLGLPWLIRNSINVHNPERSYIALKSYGIEYSILLLLAATVVLYTVIWFAKYQLKKTVGVTLICIYLVCITICILMEMDILLPNPACT